MLTKLPSASEVEIEKAATQIANALRAGFRWHENFKAMTRVPQVKTNIGIFIAYGISHPVEVARQGEVKITEARPYSVHVQSVTLVPTSQQKVLLLEAVTLRVAKKLGAPADAVVERKDPTTSTALSIELAKLEGADRAVETDPYKTIAVPFTMSMYWPAPATK